MRSPTVGQNGFNLIEVLIAVSVLGALVAVAIPNVGRFIGGGETEAAETELSNIQTAVLAMMVDNQFGTLPNPVTEPTNDMGAFPDATSVAGSPDKQRDPNGNMYNNWFDKKGYVLFEHDIIGGDGPTNLVNYLATQYTKGTYSVDASGTVTQVTTGYK